MSISKHKGEKKCTEASHLSDQFYLSHLKFSFADNEVDNFIKRFIFLMSWNMKNANQSLLISLLVFRRMFLLSLSLLCCYLASECWNFILAANKVSLTVTPCGGWLTFGNQDHSNLQLLYEIERETIFLVLLFQYI